MDISRISSAFWAFRFPSRLLGTTRSSVLLGHKQKLPRTDPEGRCLVPLTQPEHGWVSGFHRDYLLALSFSASFSSSVLTVDKFDSSLLFSNTIVSSQ